MQYGSRRGNIGFRPKPYNPSAGEESDPVLKEGNLLCNVFNRAVRSCFYTIQQKNQGRIPVGEVSEAVMVAAKQCILRYEQSMHRKYLHQAFTTVDKYIRQINKHWNSGMKTAMDDSVERHQLLVDTFHMIRVATVLMHPIAPVGTERSKQLNLDTRFWDWDYIFETIYFFMDDPNLISHSCAAANDFLTSLNLNIDNLALIQFDGGRFRISIAIMKEGHASINFYGDGL